MEKVVKLAITMSSAYLAVIHPSHIIFGVLIVVNIVDYITGILKVISVGGKISMIVAYQGIIGKINKLFYVIVALSVDIMINYNFTLDKAVSPVSAAVITWLVINELISIISNISNNGSLEVPPALLNFLVKFKD